MIDLNTIPFGRGRSGVYMIENTIHLAVFQMLPCHDEIFSSFQPDLSHLVVTSEELGPLHFSDDSTLIHSREVYPPETCKVYVVRNVSLSVAAWQGVVKFKECYFIFILLSRLFFFPEFKKVCGLVHRQVNTFLSSSFHNLNNLLLPPPPPNCLKIFSFI